MWNERRNKIWEKKNVRNNGKEMKREDYPLSNLILELSSQVSQSIWGIAKMLLKMRLYTKYDAKV